MGSPLCPKERRKAVRAWMFRPSKAAHTSPKGSKDVSSLGKLGCRCQVGAFLAVAATRGLAVTILVASRCIAGNHHHLTCTTAALIRRSDLEALPFLHRPVLQCSGEAAAKQGHAGYQKGLRGLRTQTLSMLDLAFWSCAPSCNGRQQLRTSPFKHQRPRFQRTPHECPLLEAL